MKISRAYHQVYLNIFSAEGSVRICYVLVPDGAADEVSGWAEKTSSDYCCNVVVISGMDWNHDMSPWPADGVMKKEKKFSGGAPMFLSSLLNDYMPYAERILNVKSPKRFLFGVSLSGLFSLWATVKTDAFSGVASISGSLWFDNFTEWLGKSTPRTTTEVYISLGSREKNTSDKRMMCVEDCTYKAVSILEDRGVTVMFEMVQGTHFSPLTPRLSKAAAHLLRISDDMSLPLSGE